MPQDQIRLDLGGKGLDFTLEAMGSHHKLNQGGGDALRFPCWGESGGHEMGGDGLGSQAQGDGEEGVALREAQKGRH